jgi:hypothetical protein
MKIFRGTVKKIRIGLIKTKGEKISGPKVSKRLRATASSPSPFEVILPHLIRFDLFLTTSCFPKKKKLSLSLSYSEVAWTV